MLKSTLFAVALSGAVLFAIADVASAAKAAKKPTFEEAWARCKAQIDRTVPWFEQSQRHTMGASCMKRFGYRL